MGVGPEEYGDTPTLEVFGEALHRERTGTTPPWVPINAKRINQIPKKDRGYVPSALSRDEIDHLGLLGTPSTLQDTPRNRGQQEVWDKEQRIIDWLHENGAEDIHRVGRWEEVGGGSQKTPDVVIGDRTTDFKTIRPNQIQKRAGDAAQQGRNAIMDCRGQDAAPDVVEKNLRNAVGDYGDRLDMIVVLTDEQTYIWER